MIIVVLIGVPPLRAPGRGFQKTRPGRGKAMKEYLMGKREKRLFLQVPFHGVDQKLRFCADDDLRHLGACFQNAGGAE